MRTVTLHVDLEQEKYDRLVTAAKRAKYANVGELLTALTEQGIAGALKALV